MGVKKMCDSRLLSVDGMNHNVQSESVLSTYASVKLGTTRSLVCFFALVALELK